MRKERTKDVQVIGVKAMDRMVYITRSQMMQIFGISQSTASKRIADLDKYVEKGRYGPCVRKKRSGGGTIYIDPDIFTLERNGNINTAGNYYHNGYLIGEQLYETTTSAKTLSNNTWTDTGVSIDLTAGTYVITGFVSFGQAPKGKRGIRMRNSNGNYADESTNVTVVNSSSTAGDSISLTTMLIYSANSSVTIYLQALQQSGGNLALNKSNIKAVRIA